MTHDRNEQAFAAALPDLSAPHIPHPNPKNAGEVCANRSAALKSGAIERHYFPTTAPSSNAWVELLERVALLENTTERQAQELALVKKENGIIAFELLALRTGQKE